jgi:hypothetical protein
VTHAFEILFPLVLVGLVVDLVRRMTPASPSRKAVVIGWVLWFVIGVDILLLAADRLAMNELPGVLAVAAGIAIAVAPLTLALARRVPERARRWLLGRRVWASLLVVFAGLLFFGLRIDWFTGVTMACAILLFDGDVLGRAWARVTGRAPRATGPARTSEPSLLRRRFVAVLSGFHAFAMAAILLPHAEPMAAWRESAERPLQTWGLNTVGLQFWEMFANGDRAWKSRDVVLVVQDELGNSHVVGDGILPVGDERALDRREKVRTRLDEKPWPVRHARWVCRRFDVPNGSTVTSFAVRRWVPTPEELAEMGADEAVVRIEASQSWHRIFEHRCEEREP